MLFPLLSVESLLFKSSVGGPNPLPSSSATFSFLGWLHCLAYLVTVINFPLWPSVLVDTWRIVSPMNITGAVGDHFVWAVQQFAWWSHGCCGVSEITLAFNLTKRSLQLPQMLTPHTVYVVCLMGKELQYTVVLSSMGRRTNLSVGKFSLHPFDKLPI